MTEQKNPVEYLLSHLLTVFVNGLAFVSLDYYRLKNLIQWNDSRKPISIFRAFPQILGQSQKDSNSSSVIVKCDKINPALSWNYKNLERIYRIPENIFRDLTWKAGIFKSSGIVSRNNCVDLTRKTGKFQFWGSCWTKRFRVQWIEDF